MTVEDAPRCRRKGATLCVHLGVCVCVCAFREHVPRAFPEFGSNSTEKNTEHVIRSAMMHNVYVGSVVFSFLSGPASGILRERVGNIKDFAANESIESIHMLAKSRVCEPLRKIVQRKYRGEIITPPYRAVRIVESEIA